MSSLLHARLLHHRTGQVKNSFTYPVFALLLNLDELPALERAIPFLSHNRWNVVTIADRDHRLGDARTFGGDVRFAKHFVGPTTASDAQVPFDSQPHESLKARLLRYLAAHGHTPTGKLYMLTNPRILGYGFNPVTFYYCYHADGALDCVVAEVNNTYGDQHPYLLDATNQCAPARYVAAKRFYVSPFIGAEASYEFSFSPLAEKLSVQIDEYQQGEKFFTARLWGDCEPLTARSLAAALVRYPFLTLQIMGLIHWQAVKLLWRKVPAQPHRLPEGHSAQ
jgi:DUF1365 family protein